MDFMTAVKTCFNRYVTFAGRSARAEFWYFVLFLVIGGVVTVILDMAIFPTQLYSPLNSIFSLVTILPWLAVTVRRLHDIDRVGWWIFLSFIPLVGAIVLIVWFSKAGDSGTNRFGPNPMPASEPA